MPSQKEATPISSQRVDHQHQAIYAFPPFPSLPFPPITESLASLNYLGGPCTATRLTELLSPCVCSLVEVSDALSRSIRIHSAPPFWPAVHANTHHHSPFTHSSPSAHPQCLVRRSGFSPGFSPWERKRSDDNEGRASRCLGIASVRCRYTRPRFFISLNFSQAVLLYTWIVDMLGNHSSEARPGGLGACPHEFNRQARDSTVDYKMFIWGARPPKPPWPRSAREKDVFVVVGHI